MSTVRVASIYFAPVSTKRNYRAEPYQIPAVARGASPVIIETLDLVEHDEGSMTLGPGGNRRQQLRYLVLGEEIANDIVSEWTQSGRGMTPDCHPGIWVVRERLPMMAKDPVTGVETAVLDAFSQQVFRVPTPAETAQMWDEDLQHALQADRLYAEWCWADGNDIASRTKSGNGSNTVPPNYKRAARQYGLDADWLKEAAAIDSKPCPSCGALCSKATFICKVCTQPTDLVRWAQFQAEKAAAMAQAEDFVKKGAPVMAPVKAQQQPRV